jgi:hypothetical protein
MRRIASQLPRRAPWRSMASRAYFEQLGVKRHCWPKKGLKGANQEQKNLFHGHFSPGRRSPRRKKLAESSKFGYNIASCVALILAKTGKKYIVFNSLYYIFLNYKELRVHHVECSC